MIEINLKIKFSYLDLIALISLLANLCTILDYFNK